MINLIIETRVTRAGDISFHTPSFHMLRYEDLYRWYCGRAVDMTYMQQQPAKSWKAGSDAVIIFILVLQKLRFCQNMCIRYSHAERKKMLFMTVRSAEAELCERVVFIYYPWRELKRVRQGNWHIANSDPQHVNRLAAHSWAFFKIHPFRFSNFLREFDIPRGSIATIDTIVTMRCILSTFWEQFS